MTGRTENGWKEWSNYVLEAIKEMKELREEINSIKIEFAVMKVKLAIWGAVGAMVGTVITSLIIQLIIYLIKSKVS